MLNTHRKLRWIFALLLVGLMSGCVKDDGANDEANLDEWGRPIFDPTGDTEQAPGKDDAVSGQRGLSVSVDTSPTAVWEVRNAWADTDTPAAREAGIAWGADSGLTWDQKYQAWVASMTKTETTGGYYASTTFEMQTPWGTTIPSPTLECAEVAIFLRITFASWYNLPFFLEARDGSGRLYFGHFGMRRDNGVYNNMPNFRTRYADHSSQAAAVRNGGEWPSDPSLFSKKIPGSFDDQQPQLGEGLHAGAYFDKIFLNKRVGHFMIVTLAYFGSINLADSANTFNIKPEGMKAGDVLLERWQRTGIGHTLVVMRAEDAGSTVIDGVEIPQMEAELASGSMPRRQPVWESAGASKRYFTLSNTGGEGYADLGGGIKRWRAAVNVNGRWTNMVLPEYSSLWIDSTNHTAIANRLDTFEKMLVELSADQKRDVLLGVIESKRQHLSQFPASCAARTAREDAFDALYELMAAEYGMDRDAVDAQYRIFEDYVFGELVYNQSKTCCWNRSTNAMYEIALDYNIKLQEDAQACVEPVIFMNRDDGADGFELFRQHAASLGRADEWRAWSADETCPWQNIPEATPVQADHVAYCDLPSGGETPVVPDPSGNGGSIDFSGGAIPDNDVNGFVTTIEWPASGALIDVAVTVDITHTWRGDLEIDLVHPDGTVARLKDRDHDSTPNLSTRYVVPQFVGKPAEGVYTLIVRDTAARDTGTLDAATLYLTHN